MRRLIRVPQQRASSGSGNIDSPIVSVILPTYNRAGKLPTAINSVLEQTFSAFELLVVDDGSTDETASCVGKYSYDKRVKYIYQNNAGAASARNKGLKMSGGKYVAFLDSDDKWYQWKLMLQVQILEAFKDVSLVCSDYSASYNGEYRESFVGTYFPIFRRLGIQYEDIFEKSIPLIQLVSADLLTEDQMYRKVYRGNVFKFIFQGNFIKTSTVMVRRDCLLSLNGMDESFRTGEDADLYLRLCLTNEISFVDLQTAHYSAEGDDRLSADVFSLLMSMNWYRSQKSVVGLACIKYESERAMFMRALAYRARRIALALIRENRTVEGREYAREAIRYSGTSIKGWLLLFMSYLPVKCFRSPYKYVKKILRRQVNI